jgi:hypothetical protein
MRSNRAANEDFDSENSRLKAQLSAVLRDQLMSELKSIKSAEDAALWARRILPAKNSLNVADARQIEAAFQARLAVVQNESGEPDRLCPTVMIAPQQGSIRKPGPASIDKSDLPYPEPRRIREFTVPLCRGHHREAHRCGDEATWWKNAGVDPTIAARALWRATHPLPTRLDKISSKSETPLASAAAEQSDPLLDKRDSDDETKPVFPDATQ